MIRMTKDYSHINIEWMGEILAIHGYGVTARRLLKPLIEGGAKVKLIQDEDYIPEHRRIKDQFWLDQLEKSKTMPDAPIRICYCIPPRFKKREGAINIGYAQWETTQYPREWVPAINNMDRFWVGTPSLEMSAKAAQIKVPIDNVYATIDLDLWTPEGEVTNIAEVPKYTVKFMFVGDWIPRKNYKDLIIGYITAFSGCKDTALIIKTWSNQPGADGRKAIEGAVRHFSEKLIGIEKPKIYLVTDMVEESSLISLMRSADSYVSVSHGEGFDLPLVQAMALEKVIVATGFLAHGDYLNSKNSLLVNYTLSPVYDAVAPLYHSYQLWSKPDMWSFITKLRQAYELVKTNKAKDLGKQARADAEKLFSPKNNTEALVKVIEKAGTTYNKVNAAQAIANVVAQLT